MDTAGGRYNERVGKKSGHLVYEEAEPAWWPGIPWW